MSHEDPYNLRPLWDGLLDIYAIFSSICDKHGLRFYLTDGSAIGAVRHKGFIPWDDDLDISMPRPDYERFLRISDAELPSYLKVVNWENTPEFDCMFAKVQDCRREKIESIEKKLGWELSNGLFIDIFPVDGYPEKFIQRLCYRVKIKSLWFVRRFCAQDFQSQTFKGKFAWLWGAFLAIFVFRIRSITKCLNMANGLNKSHAFDEFRLCGRSATTMWKRYVLPKAVYGEPMYFDFEGRFKVPLPHDYDTFLRYDYPDYMTPPPKEKQHPTHGYPHRCPWWLGPTRLN